LILEKKPQVNKTNQVITGSGFSDRLIEHKDGNSALILASASGYSGIALDLLRHGANIHLENKVRSVYV
jgi:hypothetical protein